MAFFKFRPSGSKSDEQSAGPAETIDGMRRRARHRLIGAALLVLIGVVGFPLMFDTQPRPVAADIPIDIPDKAKVKPLSVVKVEIAVETEAPVAAPVKEPKDTKELKIAVESSLNPKEEVVAPRVVAKAEQPAKSESTPDAKPIHKSDDDAAKVRALLDGKTVADANDGRFIVQVGAFADADKAREARQKLEFAGLKTYTQVVDTKDGQRTRVRVGPFTSKTEAEKAANKIKGMALSAAILSL